MIKLLVKNSLIYGLIPQIPRVASFFILPLITPFLTKVDYGVIGVLDVYIGLISALHFLGFNVVITNSFINHPNRYKIVWRQLYGFLLIWSIFYVIILGTIIYLTIPNEAADKIQAILFLKLVPEFFFAPIVLFVSTYYRMNHMAWPIASRSLFTGIVAVGLNYYLIATLEMGFMGWIYSGFVASIIGGILFVYPFFFKLKLFPIFNFKRRLIKKALKVGLPVVPHNYSHYLLNSSDRMIMERYNVSTGDIGVYSLSYTLGMYINIVANAINQAVSPNLLIFVKEKKWKSFENLVGLFQSMIFLVCVYASIWVSDWMPLLIRNVELNQYPELFVIIALSYSGWPLYAGCFSVLFYNEKTSMLWKITTMAGVINVILNIVLIPFFGFKVAAWTTLFAMLYQSFSGFLFKQYKENSKADLSPNFWFVMVLLAVLVSMNVFDKSIFTKILASSFFSIIVIVFVLKKVNPLKNKSLR
ncbi:MAG: lipopolysaccharide biosynthesis protein [Mongoliitalea sp.]